MSHPEEAEVDSAAAALHAAERALSRASQSEREYRSNGHALDAARLRLRRAKAALVAAREAAP